MMTHARRVHPSAVLTVLAASFVLLSGCGRPGPLRTHDFLGEWIDTLNEEGQVDDAIVLETGGPVPVIVENFAGDVTIEVDEDVSAATVRITRIARHGFDREADALAALENIHYTVETAPGELGPSLQVRTWTDDPEAHYLATHIEIILPATDGLSVVTTWGEVKAYGVEGPIDIRTTNADVLVATQRPLRDRVTIINTDGDVDLRLRAESTGVIDAETVRGRAQQRLTHGELIIRRGTDHDTLRAILNRGTNEITLRTTQGDIRVAVVDDPYRFGEWRTF